MININYLVWLNKVKVRKWIRPIKNVFKNVNMTIFIMKSTTKIWDKTKYLLWNFDPVCNGPIRITAVSLANLMRITNIKGMRARETTIIKYRLLFHKTQIKRRIDRLITFLWGRWSREGTGGRSRRGGRSDCWSSASWPPRPPCGSPWGRERTGRQG